MNKYENIRPYSMMIHDAAQMGGVEPYKEGLITYGIEIGEQNEQQKLPGIIIGAIITGIASGIPLGFLIRTKWEEYQENKRIRSQQHLQLVEEVNQMNEY